MLQIYKKEKKMKHKKNKPNYSRSQYFLIF